MKELWKDIPGWEGFYAASTKGRIKSLSRIIPRRKYGKVFQVRWTGRMMTPANMSNGYLFVCLKRNATSKSMSVHRLVAITFIKNPKKKPCVNHKNGVITRNRVTNLEWVTKSENAIHAYSTGINKRVGERHPFAKLKNSDIPEIRKSTLSFIKIGNIYGVSGTAIQHIKEGRTWARV